jgi:threonylcarbamoyladenosine tRNA methylthiotransferase MtaB
MKFNIITLGCKVNAYESNVMKEKLIESGYIYENSENADIFIVNT